MANISMLGFSAVSLSCLHLNTACFTLICDEPKKFAESARSHWRIGTKLHWSLGVTLREDVCKIIRGQATENLAGA